MWWAAKKSDSSVVYGVFTMAKPRARLLSKRIERTGRYFAPARRTGPGNSGAVTLSCVPNLSSRINGSIFFYRMRMRAHVCANRRESGHELR